MSNNSSQLLFASFQFEPSVVEITTPLNFLVKTSNGTYSILPSKYRASSFYTGQVANHVKNDIVSCTSNSTGHLICPKNSFTPANWSPNQIQSNQPTLFFKSSTTTRVAKQIVTYFRGTINSVTPRGTLRGLSQQITLTFATNTLTNNVTTPMSIFCRTNATGLSTFTATISSSTQLRCTIPYSTNNPNIILVDPFLHFPQLETANYSLANAHSHIFYYLDQGPLQFTNPSQPLFLLAGNQLVAFVLLVNYPTQEPKQYIRCRLDQGATSTTIIPTFINDNRLFNQSYNCSLPILTGGRYNISMTYNDGGNQFNMSTNSLELVVAELASINSFSPVAAGANLTTTVTIRTSFKTNVDYGPNVNYYCKLEGNFSLGNSTVVASIAQGETGSFTCTFFSSIIQTVNVTLTMVAKGIERTITSEKVSFSFIEPFFFEPSFGLHQGGELVVLKNYGGTDTNVTLNDFPQISFNCSKIGANLNCTTPNLNLFPFIQKFNSFTLKLGNRTMSMKYVNYERFTLTQVHPRVIFISGTSFPLNISMNSVFSAVQGSAVLTIDDSTANAKRYDINLQNRMNITQTVDMFSEGRYPVQLFYKNSELFEIRNSIPMSDSVNIAFVSQKSISFVGANIFPVNQATNVTVSFGSGNIFSGGITMSSLAPLMKCRLGTQYVPTFYSPTNNDFTCTVRSSKNASKR